MRIVRNLKQAKIPNKDIKVVYITMIRSLLEYASPVFSTLLTVEQINRIERVQNIALKIIYGFEHSSESVRQMAGLETLQKRRERLFVKFANETFISGRFEDWFEQREGVEYNLRNRKPIKETSARLVRTFKSPIYEMRRLLNNANGR